MRTVHSPYLALCLHRLGGYQSSQKLRPFPSPITQGLTCTPWKSCTQCCFHCCTFPGRSLRASSLAFFLRRSFPFFSFFFIVVSLVFSFRSRQPHTPSPPASQLIFFPCGLRPFSFNRPARHSFVLPHPVISLSSSPKNRSFSVFRGLFPPCPYCIKGGGPSVDGSHPHFLRSPYVGFLSAGFGVFVHQFLSPI